MEAYEAIAQSLIAEGVTDFFGLMGDGNMWGTVNLSLMKYQNERWVEWRRSIGVDYAAIATPVTSAQVVNA